MRYIKRLADQELQRRLAYSGAVVIEGAKATGKTATALQCAKTVHRFDTDPNARTLAAVAPDILLKQTPPVLLDEWQLAPELWNHVRQTVDEGSSPGHFILTGSARPADDLTRHSGAGRFSRMRIRTLTGFERSIGQHQVSLAALLRGETSAVRDPGLTVPDLAELVCRGGFPGHASLTTAQAMSALRDYVGEISRTDIREVDGVARDPLRVAAVLTALARHVGTAVRPTTLLADVAARFSGVRIARVETVSEYLAVLERLWILEYQPAFAPHLRSSTRLRSTPVVHLVDPALATAALGATPESLLRDLNFFGLLFESMVLRDLRVFTHHQLSEVQHYRDETGLEVDAIVIGADGAWCAIEIKLGASPGVVDAAAESLLKFAARIDTTRMGTPAALAVLTGTGPGFVRKDGVVQIPYGALGP
jgi:predicted AAA+ superfamily ATPase